MLPPSLKKFISKIPYYKDIWMCAVLVIPMYIQWLVWYLTPREKKCVKGKLALITGAGRGLGKEMATKFATLGCNIAIADINKAVADVTAEEISQLGVKAKAYRVDVTNPDEIIQLRADVERDFGVVDILINNAGIVSFSNLEDEPSLLSAMINVNLLGVVLVTKYFFEKMKEQGKGHIVSISSMGGIHASPHIITYTATKFGVNGFMQGLHEHLRIENLSDKIKTTCAFPYYVKTQPAVEKWLHPNIRFKALNVKRTAENIVNAILEERVTVTVPEGLELVMRIANYVPLRIQQILFRDRMIDERHFKNPDF